MLTIYTSEFKYCLSSLTLQIYSLSSHKLLSVLNIEKNKIYLGNVANGNYLSITGKSGRMYYDGAWFTSKKFSPIRKHKETLYNTISKIEITTPLIIPCASTVEDLEYRILKADLKYFLYEKSAQDREFRMLGEIEEFWNIYSHGFIAMIKDYGRIRLMHPEFKW